MAYTDLQTILPAIVTGTQAPAAWGLAIRDNFESIVRGPRVRVERALGLSVNSGANTAVSWSVRKYELPGANALWPSGDPTKLVASIAGLYPVAANVLWDAVVTPVGVRVLQIVRNGIDIVERVDGTPLANRILGMSVSGDVALAAGDFLQVWLYHDHGSAVAACTNQPNSFSMRWAGLTT